MPCPRSSPSAQHSPSDDRAPAAAGRGPTRSAAGRCCLGRRNGPLGQPRGPAGLIGGDDPQGRLTGTARTNDRDLRICECRCGAPGWRTSRLGVGDSMWLSTDLAASACPSSDLPVRWRTAARFVNGQGVRGVTGKLRGSRAELRWPRMHVPALDQRSQPVACVPRPPWQGRGQGSIP